MTRARVRSVAVRIRQTDQADQQDFRNSFIAVDLGLLADALRAGVPGAGLASYLTPAAAVNQVRRVDLRRDPRAALDGVGPSCTPAERWAEPGHPLTLTQQFAVNTMWS
jgi:hypothetical protein